MIERKRRRRREAGKTWISDPPGEIPQLAERAAPHITGLSPADQE